MKDYFIQKDLIPTTFLDLAHQDICNLIDTTSNLKKIGGYKSGHLNVRVGKYLKEFIDVIDQKDLTKKIEKFYGIDLQ